MVFPDRTYSTYYERLFNDNKEYVDYGGLKERQLPQQQMRQHQQQNWPQHVQQHYQARYHDTSISLHVQDQVWLPDAGTLGSGNVGILRILGYQGGNYGRKMSALSQAYLRAHSQAKASLWSSYNEGGTAIGYYDTAMRHYTPVSFRLGIGTNRHRQVQHQHKHQTVLARPSFSQHFHNVCDTPVVFAANLTRWMGTDSGLETLSLSPVHHGRMPRPPTEGNMGPENIPIDTALFHEGTSECDAQQPAENTTPIPQGPQNITILPALLHPTLGGDAKQSTLNSMLNPLETAKRTRRRHSPKVKHSNLKSQKCMKATRSARRVRLGGVLRSQASHQRRGDVSVGGVSSEEVLPQSSTASTFACYTVHTVPAFQQEGDPNEEGSADTIVTPSPECVGTQMGESTVLGKRVKFKAQLEDIIPSTRANASQGSDTSFQLRITRQSVQKARQIAGLMNNLTLGSEEEKSKGKEERRLVEKENKSKNKLQMKRDDEELDEPDSEGFYKTIHVGLIYLGRSRSRRTVH